MFNGLALDRLGRLNLCISPLGWWIHSLAVVASWVVVLEPTLMEFVRVVFFDLVLTAIYFAIEGKAFLRFHPQFKPIFPDLDWEALAKVQTQSQRLKLMGHMESFPSIRANWLLKTIPLKTIPLITYVGLSAGDMLPCLAFGLIVFCAGVSLSMHSHSESQRAISELVLRIHARMDWTAVFHAGPANKGPSNGYMVSEQVYLVFLAMLGTVLQSVVIAMYRSEPAHVLLFKSLIVNGSFVILFSRWLWVVRKFFVAGLNQLFDQMDRVDRRTSSLVVPLHASPLLSRGEGIFNRLLARLRKSEMEVSEVVAKEASASRYQALGEISALVAHDLSGPLHVVKFCIEQIERDPEKAVAPRYVEQLKTNVAAAVSLIDSLRARLRNPEASDVAGSAFMDSHRHVLRLLETQFGAKGFSKILWSVDPRLLNARLEISPVDLTHVLDNLYRNSVRNLLDSEGQIERLEISVAWRSGPQPDQISIVVQDTGTGLGAEQFQKLMSMESREAGLGLRLTLRLIEQNDGYLEWLGPSDVWSTRLRLSLKVPSQDSLRRGGQT